MPLNVWFWVFFLVWTLTSFWWGWNTPTEGRYPIAGYSLFLFLLIALLGWATFGSAIK